MSGLKSLWLGGALSAAVASAAFGADLPTKKGEAAAPPAVAPIGCPDATQFFTTDCKLSYYGVTLYGVVDLGVGWESHGAALNPGLISGVQELIGKSGNKSMWLATPGGLSQSLIGVRVKEPLAGDWSLVGDWSFAFDPYTLSAANGPYSFYLNNGKTLVEQSATGDSSRAGQFYNGTLYAGVSNPVYGTLTLGRQNSLTLDGVIEYDPMGAAFAYSVIGWSGVTAGVANTEDARATTAAKYRGHIGNVRFSAIYQFGGYDLNNGAQGQVQGGIGVDFDLGAYGNLTTDAIYAYEKGAVASAPLTPAQNLLHPGTLAATISDNNGVMLLGRWTNDRYTISGGYELIDSRNPSSPQLSNFTDIAGYTVVAADINNKPFPNTRYLQSMWIGGRYKITPTLDTGVGIYHYIQNSYGVRSCSNSSAPTCSGTLEGYSWDIDWQFSKKFDVYAGVFFSEVHDGLSAGYLHGENLSPTAGVRFRF
jgi:predicted porin